MDHDNPKLANLIRWFARTIGPLLASGQPWRVTINGGANAMDIKAEITQYEVLRM